MGRPQLIVPALLVQPGLRLRAKPRLDPLALGVSPIPLGTGDDLCRIDSSYHRRVEFRARGLLRIRKIATVRIDAPEGLKITIGAILDLTRASGASSLRLFNGLFHWSVLVSKFADTFDISGSANWVNKADLGIVIHRDPDKDPTRTDVLVRKVRFKSVGKIGGVSLRWDQATGRYYAETGIPITKGRRS